MSLGGPLTLYRCVSAFISKFVELEYGNEEGKCVFCGFRTRRGFPKKLPKTFTAWSLLQAGEVICPACHYLLKNEDFRRRSWLITSEGIRFMKAKEMLTYILKPPAPPFTIYVTLQGKKHGWIQLNQVGVNYSMHHYFVGFEENVIYVSRILANTIYDKAREARELGASKSELLTALPRPKTAKKTGRGIWGELGLLKERGEDVYELIIKLL